MNSSPCAPFFFGEMNGPSRFTPTIFAPSLSSMQERIVSSAFKISASETVIVVGQKDVTPFVSRNFAILRRPSASPSLESAPAPPCT